LVVVLLVVREGAAVVGNAVVEVLGAAVGAAVGNAVVDVLGAAVGAVVGIAVVDVLGAAVGTVVGNAVVEVLGAAVGAEFESFRLITAKLLPISPLAPPRFTLSS